MCVHFAAQTQEAQIHDKSRKSPCRRCYRCRSCRSLRRQKTRKPRRRCLVAQPGFKARRPRRVRNLSHQTQDERGSSQTVPQDPGDAKHLVLWRRGSAPRWGFDVGRLGGFGSLGGVVHHRSPRNPKARSSRGGRTQRSLSRQRIWCTTSISCLPSLHDNSISASGWGLSEWAT